MVLLGLELLMGIGKWTDGQAHSRCFGNTTQSNQIGIFTKWGSAGTHRSVACFPFPCINREFQKSVSVYILL